VSGGRGTRLSHAAFARLWRDGSLSTDAIAARLGISRQAVSQRARARGLPQRRGGMRARVVDAALFARMWRAGVPTSEMARYFGYAHHNCVSTRARLDGLPPRRRGSAGRRNGGWESGLSLAQFLEAEVGRRMREVS